MRENLDQHFDNIYKTKAWQLAKDDPLSGPGSNPIYCRPFINFFWQFVKEHSVVDIVDYGCGDTAMWGTNIFESNYLGIDVSVTALNIAKSMQPKAQFTTDTEIPNTDLILIKNVMIHWYDEEINEWITNIKGKFKFLMIVDRDVNNINDSWFARHNRNLYIDQHNFCPININNFFKSHDTYTFENFLARVFIIKGTNV